MRALFEEYGSQLYSLLICTLTISAVLGFLKSESLSDAFFAGRPYAEEVIRLTYESPSLDEGTFDMKDRIFFAGDVFDPQSEIHVRDSNGRDISSYVTVSSFSTDQPGSYDVFYSLHYNGYSLIRKVKYIVLEDVKLESDV